MRRLLTFSLLVAAVLLGALFWFRGEPPQSPKTQAQQTKALRLTKKSHPSGGAETTREPTVGRVPTVALQSIKYVPDYATIARAHENPPFEFRGGGTSGKVVDRDGKVLMESGSAIGIYGTLVSPDGKHVLVKGGSSINFVLSPTTQGKMQLPIRPPGTNMLGFGSWYWINDHSLVGESGIAKVEKDGRTWRGSDNVAQSKLYVYDIVEGKLTEVALPAKFDAKVFGIVDSSLDGYIQLHFTSDAPEEKNPDEMGWFKVGTP